VVKKIAYWVIAGGFGLSACDSRPENKMQPAIQAGIASVSYARKDGVDFNVFSLTWITELANGEMQIVDSSQTTPLIEEIRADLRGKKYWEACYGVIEELVLGGMYCYYMDYNTFDLLATYRTK
jgi:hypothetical protein